MFEPRVPAACTWRKVIRTLPNADLEAARIIGRGYHRQTRLIQASFAYTLTNPDDIRLDAGSAGRLMDSHLLRQLDSRSGRRTADARQRERALVQGERP